MNIDELKDAWNNDGPKGMRLPDNTAMLGKTSSVVARIRKNMRAEFIALLVSYGILMLFLFKGPHTAFFFNITSILLFAILSLNVFYYFRFYIFYRSVGRYDFSLKDSIRKIAYELELNTEIYKTYNFSMMPLAVLATVTLISGKGTSDLIQHILGANDFISPANMLLIFLTILISFTISYVCISWHVRLQYGRYITELKRILDDLGSEG